MSNMIRGIVVALLFLFGGGAVVQAQMDCRIAVYSNAGGSMIATVKSIDLFVATGLRHADTLAQDVERELLAIIDEAAA